eukprot:s57_g7.t1
MISLRSSDGDRPDGQGQYCLKMMLEAGGGVPLLAAQTSRRPRDTEVAEDAQHLRRSRTAQAEAAKRKAPVSRPSRCSRLMSLSPQAAALVAAGDVPQHDLTEISSPQSGQNATRHSPQIRLKQIR